MTQEFVHVCIDVDNIFLLGESERERKIQMDLFQQTSHKVSGELQVTHMN